MIHLLCVIFLQILVGGEWGQGVRFSVIHVGSSRGSLLKEMVPQFPCFCRAPQVGTLTLSRVSPGVRPSSGEGGGQGRWGVELWSQIAATDVVSGRHLVACVRNVRPRLADPWT